MKACNQGIHPGSETQGSPDQKSKTLVSLLSSKKISKKLYYTTMLNFDPHNSKSLDNWCNLSVTCKRSSPASERRFNELLLRHPVRQILRRHERQSHLHHQVRHVLLPHIQVPLHPLHHRLEHLTNGVTYDEGLSYWATVLRGHLTFMTIFSDIFRHTVCKSFMTGWPTTTVLSSTLSLSYKEYSGRQISIQKHPLSNG